MFRKFAVKVDTPKDVERFEGWFLLSLVSGIVVAILMYEEVVKEWGGPYQAAIVTIVLFGGAWVLMVYASRRRRNWARWLLVIGSIFAVVPYLAHVSLLLTQEPIFLLSFVQAALQVTALCYLFTDASRAWFAGRLLPPKEEKEEMETVD
jgi:uncharacterized membrane protein